MAKLNTKRCFLEFVCHFYKTNKCKNSRKKEKCFVSRRFFFKNCKEINKEEKKFKSLSREKIDSFTGLEK